MSRKRSAIDGWIPATPPLSVNRSTFELVIAPRDRLPLFSIGLLWLVLAIGGAAVLSLRFPVVASAISGVVLASIIAQIGIMVSILHIRSHVQRGPYLHADLRDATVLLGHANQRFTVEQIRSVAWAFGVIKPSPYHDDYEPRSWVFVETSGDSPALMLVCVNPRVRGGAKRIAETAAEFFRKPCQRISLEAAVRNSGSG